MARPGRLIVLLEGRRVGEVTRERGRLAFAYDEDWRADRDAYPLSLSMPLTAAEHGPRAVEAFLWGLLPDNPLVLERWGRRFQVSARNPFALIAEVGEDCAGAVQMVRPEREAELMERRDGGVDWLDEAEVAARLRALQADPSAWRAPRDAGWFSLAGAQPKTALLFQHGRWGVPWGVQPTSHILKPPTGALDGHPENEHFCLSLARALDLPTAGSAVTRFEDQIAIVVQRYDRRAGPAGLARVHQEDFCQALAHPPAAKYENEGGPGVKACVQLLAAQSREPGQDGDVFLDAVLFNWLIGGTDAHAKNYSLLIGQGADVRLAPLYDIASALPYPDLDYQKLKLAMKLGGEYRLRDIGPRQVRKLAADTRRDPDELLARAAAMAARLPDLAIDMARRVRDDGLEHPITERLAELLARRAEQIRAGLEG